MILRRLLVCPWLLALVLAAPAFPAEPLRLQTGQLTVELEQAPFRLRVLGPDGEVLLHGLGDTDAPVDPWDAFGNLGYSWNVDVTLGKPPYYGYDWYQGLPTQWHHSTRILGHTLDGDTLRLTLGSEDLRGHKILVTLQVLGPRSFRLHAEPSDPGVANRMAMSFHLPAAERFFGFGERFYHTEHRGRKLHCWVEDGGFGLGGLEPKNAHDPFPYGPMMTNWPSPFLLSSRGYGLWLDTTHRTTLDLGHDDKGVLRLEAETSRFDMVFFYGPRPLEVLEQFTAIVGRAPLPDMWSFAPRIRSNLGSGLPARLRAAGAGVTGLDTALHFLPGGGHRGREEGIRAGVQNDAALGFKVLSYFNNFVSADFRPVFDEGVASGYFVKNPAGATYIVGYPGYPRVALVDFTNPAAVEWYKRLLDESADLGFHGFMYDFAEYVPRDAVFFDGRRGTEVHNEYPVLYQKAAYEQLTERFGTDYMFFARSGYTGSQRYAFTWPGDLDSTWSRHNGLPSAVFAGLSIGMSGFPFYGSEIGGYHMIFNPPPDKELYQRWVEFAAYSPMMMEQSDGYSVNGPDSPIRWQWWSDAETLAHFTHFTREHTALLPYIYAYAKVASETGAPVMRHLFLEYPDDPQVYGLDTEYLLGREMLVAPVVEQGAVERRVYLPTGQWVEQATGERFQGPGLLVAPAPPGRVPVYVRSGAIIPRLDPDVETLAPSSDPDIVDIGDRGDRLEVHVYPDALDAAGFTLADGTELRATANAGLTLPPTAVRSRVHGDLPALGGPGSGWWTEPGALHVKLDAASDEIDILGAAGATALQLSVQGAPARQWHLVVHLPQPPRALSTKLDAPRAAEALFALAALLFGLRFARARRQRAVGI